MASKTFFPSLFPLRKLPARWAGFIMPLTLSVMMTSVISFVVTALGFGLTVELLHRWPLAWGTSWIVAFPTLLLVLPLVRRFVALVVDLPGGR
ncbi:DUF2798 domain-containing protein [Methylobacterium aerolatum]|uniref:DUF2798 domain-containing protein n=1 Tax=Methylobacterium aerolatum TaxID=418708 RepID=A0ABU0HVS6_9HYPH|nr:DUF2798 domain-containing protein [Methylobacterium aerolatum]MDQ0446433.1 hypothetical protein [Methylobacterium aerolatum]GJD33404.1 hypothetical protein FMGBMHLM_0291 [Methylobacterium aerolatum]